MSMQLPDDYEAIRKSGHCPLCGSPKEESNLVCSPCYKQHKMRRGLTAAVVAKLEAVEKRLIWDSLKAFE